MPIMQGTKFKYALTGAGQLFTEGGFKLAPGKTYQAGTGTAAICSVEMAEILLSRGIIQITDDIPGGAAIASTEAGKLSSTLVDLPAATQASRDTGTQVSATPVLSASPTSANPAQRGANVVAAPEKAGT